MEQWKEPEQYNPLEDFRKLKEQMLGHSENPIYKPMKYFVYVHWLSPAVTMTVAAEQWQTQQEVEKHLRNDLGLNIGNEHNNEWLLQDTVS